MNELLEKTKSLDERLASARPQEKPAAPHRYPGRQAKPKPLPNTMSGVPPNAPEPVMRLAAVLMTTGGSTAELYKAISEGRFPAPIRTGKRTVAWLTSDVLRFQRERIAERDERLASKATARAAAEDTA
jgi:prophage regulatory protein